MYVKNSWMLRTSLPRASPQIVDPADDDSHDTYESHEASDDPSVSVSIAPEVSDGNVRAARRQVVSICSSY